MSRRQAIPSGFTLVEVIVALAVGGLVTLTAAATATTLPNLASSADARIGETLGAVAVRSQIRGWLVSSFATGDSLFEGEFTGFDGTLAGADVLRFPLRNPDEASPGRAVLTLAVGAIGGPEAGLVALIEPARGPIQTLPVAPAATGLEIQYLYFVSGSPRWYDGWQSRVERPAAVRLWLQGLGLPDLLRLPITVWLRG